MHNFEQKLFLDFTIITKLKSIQEEKSTIHPFLYLQDYESMIQIVEGVPVDHCEIQNRAIQQVYAFALNRYL